jgi:hypothetical protein
MAAAMHQKGAQQRAFASQFRFMVLLTRHAAKMLPLPICRTTVDLIEFSHRTRVVTAMQPPNTFPGRRNIPAEAAILGPAANLPNCVVTHAPRKGSPGKKICALMVGERSPGRSSARD